MDAQQSAQEWVTSFAPWLPGGVGAIPSAEEQALILELSRIAAHASERIAAPIVSYMVGAAVAGMEPAARAAELRRLVDGLRAAGDD